MTKTQNHSSPSPDERDDKDANLTAFLRQYAPSVPESAGDAENRLMMAISRHQEFAGQGSGQGRTNSRSTRKNRSLKRQIAIVAGCSALVYGLWQLSQVILQPTYSAGELAEIENFWFQNWDGVANAEETYSWLKKGDPGLDSAAEPSTSEHFDASHPRQE